MQLTSSLKTGSGSVVKTRHLLASVAVVLATSACGWPAAPRQPTPMPAGLRLPTPTPTPIPQATPVAGPAPTVTTCPPGASPTFVLGFAELKQRLGDRMGTPLTCERPGPEGDSLQQTTTGMARYRKSTNVPSFTQGDEHWALTERGLVYWRGRALDPPDDAEVVVDDTTLARGSTPIPAPVATRTQPVDEITLPEDSGEQLIPGLPEWIQKPLLLLREYDRRNATILVPSIVRADISVARLGGADGAWGLFVPSSHRIVLDASLAGESPQAVAAVLGHEADHARDTFQYGPPRGDAACYTFEITAFVLEARIWSSFYGPSGKPEASTALEQELNLILEASRANPGTLIGSIKNSYQSECA
jgi:hypothetical protein